ncbi:hypothetical protein EBBID32_5800 [Sphingobium indicum BiD32]|uniref:Uncharacterized protein n=1 Tax=Sphingobium indicum BiD32 TaxID=1301087 RepID=N1MLD7_9SPHN|nr:hypothetical protein EBBID32_5800 [Sphingobium indicum BiD32]
MPPQSVHPVGPYFRQILPLWDSTVAPDGKFAVKMVPINAPSAALPAKRPTRQCNCPLVLRPNHCYLPAATPL